VLSIGVVAVDDGSAAPQPGVLISAPGELTPAGPGGPCSRSAVVPERARAAVQHGGAEPRRVNPGTWLAYLGRRGARACIEVKGRFAVAAARQTAAHEDCDDQEGGRASHGCSAGRGGVPGQNGGAPVVRMGQEPATHVGPSTQSVQRVVPAGQQEGGPEGETHSKPGPQHVPPVHSVPVAQQTPKSAQLSPGPQQLVRSPPASRCPGQGPRSSPTAPSQHPPPRMSLHMSGPLQQPDPHW